MRTKASNLMLKIYFVLLMIFMISCNDSSINPINENPYNLSLWTNYLNGVIKVSIDGKYAGDITKAYLDSIEDCNAEGCFTISFNSKKNILITATESVSGFNWQYYVDVDNSCKKVMLENKKYVPPPPPKKYELSISCEESLCPLMISVNADSLYLDEYDFGTLYSSNDNLIFQFSSAKTIYIELVSTGNGVKQGIMEKTIKEGENYLYIRENDF